MIYEEYTANFNIGVLDGAFFSMYGLFDLKRSQPDLPNLDNLISNGVKGLLNLLPEYDMGFWLKYSKTEAEFYPSFDPATKAYFYLVLSQLKVFYYYTGEEQFDRYYQHFLKYDTFKNVIKMYIQKYKALDHVCCYNSTQIYQLFATLFISSINRVLLMLSKVSHIITIQLISSTIKFIVAYELNCYIKIYLQPQIP